MLLFYDVPTCRNISLKRDPSRLANLPSRMDEKLVIRQLCFQLTMLFGASEEVCHDFV